MPPVVFKIIIIKCLFGATLLYDSREFINVHRMRGIDMVKDLWSMIPRGPNTSCTTSALIKESGADPLNLDPLPHTFLIRLMPANPSAQIRLPGNWLR